MNEIIDNFPSLCISSKDLPILKYKSKIIETIQNNQVTIIYGETGSGKTTQIPQYLLNANINDNKIIGITQPRRIAAISMARRVAQEMGCALGFEVGYQVRFENKCRASTKIKYMTDGTLLNICLADTRLSEYGVIIIDEAHERALHTDVLLGLLKKIINKRKDLKVLITSATIKSEKFSTYFNNAPIVLVEGRLFPVEIKYQNCYLYIDEAVDIVKKIHNAKEKGDILLFMTGQEDIEVCCAELRNIQGLIVLSLYGLLESELQQKVFEKVKDGERKVVVATNIAETTITIDGIVFVIDCGYVKQNTFNPGLGIEVLEEKRISKAQADQRKGRAGRTSNGHCYRLYSQYIYEAMPEETVPEIMRKNLCEIYLKIITIGLDPMMFDFIDKPETEKLKVAEKELQELDLLDDNKKLTKLGEEMSDLPVEPILGKVLLSAHNFYCTKDIVTIMSMMTENKVFKRSKNPRQVAIHKSFEDPDGDHLTQLNVFNAFEKNEKSKTWCYDNFMNFDTLSRVDLARDQLIMILNRKNIVLEHIASGKSRDPIRQAIIKGYYRNICVMISKGKYIRCLDKEILFIHPGSVLFKECPKVILYNAIVQTKKRYMHGIMKLDDSILVNFTKEMKKINYNPGISFGFMDF